MQPQFSFGIVNVQLHAACGKIYPLLLPMPIHLHNNLCYFYQFHISNFQLCQSFQPQWTVQHTGSRGCNSSVYYFVQFCCNYRWVRKKIHSLENYFSTYLLISNPPPQSVSIIETCANTGRRDLCLLLLVVGSNMPEVEADTVNLEFLVVCLLVHGFFLLIF